MTEADMPDRSSPRPPASDPAPQNDKTAQLSERLAAFLKRSHGARSVRIEGLRLLTGGASRQTWSFDAAIEHADGRSETLPLVFRSDARRGPTLMTRETEYQLLKAAGEEGVPVPKVHLMGDDSLGEPGFLMARVEGETIARKLLRDGEYAEARQVMTAQLGAILAAIHRVPIEKPVLSGVEGPVLSGVEGPVLSGVEGPVLSGVEGHGLASLPSPAPGLSPAESEVNRFEQTYRLITPEPHPAFELAFRWLRQHLPPAAEPALVHGDYRIGNVIFGPEGVRAILDWELAHIGDPIEDVAWICVRSWRFGNDHLPAGGIGTREELWRAYEAAGGRRVDPETARFWELFGNLRWGIFCINQARAYLEGLSKPVLSRDEGSVELASIGRRTAETEWELLNLMEVT